MTDGQLVLFDYATLDPETRIVVQQRTSEIKTLMRRTAQDIIDIGQKLIEVKARIGYGNFGAWLKAEFAWSDQTALNFMNVARRFGDFPNSLDFAPSVLYLLAAPSTPDEARNEALERHAAGETITHSKAKQIVEAHTVIAAAALDTNDPPRLAINAALEVLEEYHATGGYVTLDDGEQVEADEPGTLLDATRAAYDERAARQSQHIQDSVAKKAYKNSSESNEWYTPRYLIDKAIAVMGGIDLDPATNKMANRTVQASEIFTEHTNGLLQDWFGCVWLNPPYGDAVGAWIDKLVNEYEAGRISEALLLVASRTDTVWFRRLRSYPRCFLWGRIKFINGETGEIGEPAGFPSMVVYLGNHPSQFVREFEDVGDVYAWVNTTSVNS